LHDDFFCKTKNELIGQTYDLSLLFFEVKNRKMCDILIVPICRERLDCREVCLEVCDLGVRYCSRQEIPMPPALLKFQRQLFQNYSVPKCDFQNNFAQFSQANPISTSLFLWFDAGKIVPVSGLCIFQG